MNKHAYLIIAHNDFYILEKLLMLLDDERNDIYIHIDKKVKSFNLEYFQRICSKSHIKFIKRIKVYWGGYSQVQCELNLLKEASKNNYEYYHLLSGVDLPIKTQNYIHDYFNKNKGTEFIRFMKNGWDYNRVSKVHLINDYCRANNKFLARFYIVFNKIANKFINKNNYDRTKKFNYKFQKGDNWFSITNECVKYILSSKNLIRKMFKYSNCPDEHFIQTLIYNSKFKNNISYDTCLREIDWNRGCPYVFKLEDYDILMKSENLFARKFDSNQDRNIIDKIYQELMGDKGYGVNKYNSSSV